MNVVNPRLLQALEPHTATTMDGNVLIFVVHGNIRAEHAQPFIDMIDAHAEIHGRFPFVAYVQEMSGMDSGARRSFVHVDRPYPFAPCFIVGASFTIRTVILGVHRAGRVLFPRFFDWSMVMVQNDAEWQQWLRENA
ncbi:MAG TPA: hypothetical protein PK156_37340 [Polyangium sp.]|nr:hypothetical protein [Polyangium sp.]